jgi:hypothetical protein
MSFQEGEEGEVELEIEDEETLEHMLLVVREVAVYKIPPRSTSGGHKCGEWLQSDKIWAGHLRVVSCKARCEIRLEDPGSGDLFAACFVQPDQPREAAVETVLDSSRYFVLRIITQFSLSRLTIYLLFSEFYADGKRNSTSLYHGFIFFLCLLCTA